MQTVIENEKLVKLVSRNGRHDLTVTTGGEFFVFNFERVSTPFKKTLTIHFDELHSLIDIVNCSKNGWVKFGRELIWVNGDAVYAITSEPVVAFHNLVTDGSMGCPMFERKLIVELMSRLEQCLIENEKFQFMKIAFGIKFDLGESVQLTKGHYGEWFAVIGIYLDEEGSVMYKIGIHDGYFKQEELGKYDG